MRNLNVYARAASLSVICQRSEPTFSIGRPFSQLRPGPSPRTKSALPKPTSTRAAMVVLTGFVATAVTVAFVAGTGLGASMATGVLAVARTVSAAAVFLSAAGFAGAGLGAGAGGGARFPVLSAAPL